MAAVVPSWVLLVGALLCLALAAALAVAIYLGSGREPSRPDD